MFRLIFPALLLLAVPASAALFDYKWTGSVDFGSSDVLEVSGAFRYDDAAKLIWRFEDGEEIRENGYSGITFKFGNESYARTDGWESHTVGGKSYFTEAILDQGGMDNGARLTWDDENWYASFWNGDSSLREIGGKILKLYKEAYFPDGGDDDKPTIPGGDGCAEGSRDLLAFIR